MPSIDHEAITAVMFRDGQCVGSYPNPFIYQDAEQMRRNSTLGLRNMIDRKIDMLFEPRFITPFQTAELISALATSSAARNILEIGTYSGFTTLHLIKTIVGLLGAKVTTIDARPAHDTEWFSKPEIAPYFRFIQAWTPQALLDLRPEIFDFVFIDSDHSCNHTRLELDALWQITKPGCPFIFHDVPEWQTPDNKTPAPVREYLMDLVKQGKLVGLCFPTPEQADCLATYGPGYPPQCNPHLGIFLRT